MKDATKTTHSVEVLVCIVNYSILSSTTWRNKKIDFFQFPNGKQGFFQWVLKNCCGNCLFLPHMICLHFHALFSWTSKCFTAARHLRPTCSFVETVRNASPKLPPWLETECHKYLSQPVNNQSEKPEQILPKKTLSTQNTKIIKRIKDNQTGLGRSNQNPNNFLEKGWLPGIGYPRGLLLGAPDTPSYSWPHRPLGHWSTLPHLTWRTRW